MDQFIPPQENNSPQQVPTNSALTEPSPTDTPSQPEPQPDNQPPVNQSSTNEPQVQTIGESPQKNAKRSSSFRAIFLILLLITMLSAGATTFIILNWSKPTDSTSNAQIVIPTPTLKDLENTQVEVNPFSDAAIAGNPFEQSATDSVNIFNEFEESTDSGEEYQNPF